MKQAKVAIRYARALLELAQEQGLIDVFGEQLQDFLQKLTQPSGLLEQNNQDDSSAQERINRVDVLTQKLGYDPWVTIFLKLLAKKQRLVLLDLIIGQYTQLADQVLGRKRLTITTPAEIAPEDSARVAGFFSDKFKYQVLVHTRIDPSLLGGIRVQMGDHIFDDTLQTHLKKLTRTL